jgi:uncharacterized membrane protein YgcG
MNSDADRTAAPGAAASQGPPSLPGPVSPLRILAALCLVAPFVAMLWIPSYNKVGSTLFGFPFFYWYQLLWVILTALLMVVAYWAVQHDKGSRRTAGAVVGSGAFAGSGTAAFGGQGGGTSDTGNTGGSSGGNSDSDDSGEGSA